MYPANDNVLALEHPPCVLDLSPPDSFLFVQLKRVLKGQQFMSAEEVIAKVRALTEVLENGFQECFQKLNRCRQKFVNA
jgi:hypothetical protein